MKNLKVSMKLFLSFGIVLALMVVIIIMASLSLVNVSGKLTTFYNGPYQNVTTAEEINGELNEAAKNMLHACVDTDEVGTKERLNAAQEIFDEIGTDIEELRKNYKGDQSDVTAIEKGLGEIEEAYSSFRELCTANDIDGAFAIYTEQILTMLAKVDSSLTTIQEGASAQAVKSYQSGESTSRSSIILMVVLGIVCVLTGAGLAVYITRILVSCITELKDSSLRMSEGDFDAPLTYHSRDELGELSHGMRIMTENIKEVINDANRLLSEMAAGNFQVHTQAQERYVGAFAGLLSSMRSMNSNLSNTLGQINQASEQVASGSEQVSAGAQALSQGATEQASSIEELAATINEISGQVADTAENAMSAREQTGKAGDEVAVCNQEMQDMIAAMSEISNKSNEIGKIIKTIEDIAFQTNILALNAAVEAARAGTAGKGFAVVADEVRSLANKSQDASRDTSSLIEGSLQAVEKGTHIANETAASLARVVEDTKAVEHIVDKIADAANTQAGSISQVTQGIDQISSVIQTNSATAEESAATSEELSGQAQILKELVGQFKLKEAHSEVNMSDTTVSSNVMETASNEIAHNVKEHMGYGGGSEKY